jgi:competence protein ComEC
MNSWRPYPLLRLLFPFTAGIIAEVLSGSDGGQSWLLFAVLVFLLVVSQIYPLMITSYRFRWITGLLINMYLLMAGYGIASCHRTANDPDYLGNHPDGLFIATLAEPPALNVSGIKAILEVKFRYENGIWVRSCGSAVGYLKVKPGATLLQYGDYVLIRAGFTIINDNSNPHSFNYAHYMKNKGISHRVFAEPYSWTLLNFSGSGFIRKMAFQVRDRLLDILRDNHVEGKEFAVAAALLLGYVNELDADLRNDYAATGAMHILSVSGMHVGIIYIFLEFLLGFLNKNKMGRILKAVMLLVFIWFYAMVTGLSPCVLRSAAMLSLPILGKSLNRSPDMYNIIAASLVFILAFDPFLILDVGFQLSYLAVTGIIILYKPIYDLYVTSAWFPDKVWSILAVSIAAQLATLPITLYTFHQFPNYFMLTNVFVVPLSSLIIYIGITVLVVGYVPVISVICAKVFIFQVWSLNSVIHFIEQLPCSTIRGIYISTPEMMLLYLMIGAGFLFLTLRKTSYLYILLIAAIFLNLSFLEFKVHRLRSSQLIIFNANHEARYMFSAQDKAIIFYNGRTRFGAVLQKSNQEMAMAEMNALGIHYSREYWLYATDRPEVIAKSFVPLIKHGSFIQFAGCRIAILDRSIPKCLTARLDVDMLIITGNPKINMADAIKIFHPAQIIIDPTNSRYKSIQWMKECCVLRVKCHAVTDIGAFLKVF